MTQEFGGFETRLLAELTEVVERGPRRRLFTMPRLAIGGVALAALAVTGGLTLPVFGGASERSPSSGVVAAPPVEPVGFSLSVASDEVTVTVDFIDDDAALEAALLEEGVDANVVILGDDESCQWQGGEGIAPADGDGAAPTEGASTITINTSDFDDAKLLLVIYTLPGGDEVSAMMIGADFPGSGQDCSARD